MNIRTFRLILWSAVVVILAASTIAYIWLRVPEPGTVTGTADLGKGDYELVGSNGQPVTQASFVGKPTMLFFGYTHCPDVCPVTLSEMGSWFEALGDSGKNLQAFFVTVDPERDTPQIVADYAGAVTPRITAVSGDPAEVQKALAAWRVYSKKVPGKDGDYTMDHTAAVYLLNAKGEFEGTIAFGESNAVALEKLKRLVG